MNIKLKNIRKNYGSFEAIKGVSTEFKEGGFYGLLGPNGAGKTTLFNLLIQAIAKTSGVIDWSVNEKKVEQHALYQHIGVVFQSGRLDSQLTVEENLIIRGSLYGLKKKEVLSRIAEIDQYLKIEELKKKRYGNLSGGQKRKIDIARALVHNPSLLLLDEPTTGLDPKSRKDLWDVIYRLNKQKKMTVILITHYLEEMTYCDTLDVLVEGKLYYSGDIPTFIEQHAQMNLLLTLKQNESIQNLTNDFQEKRQVRFQEVIYQDISMDDIMVLIAKNQPKQIIESFNVQYATLEAAYLNLLEKIKKEKK